MSPLANLPCLWIAPDPAPLATLYRMNRYLPNYFRITPGDSAAMVRFLDRESADHVLVLTSDLLPHSSLPHYLPDPLLLSAGQGFALLGRNAVTRGYDDRHGPMICLRARLLAEQEVRRPDTVVPVALADWQCNESAETAFAAGFETVSNLPTEEAVLAACLGADVPFGQAWILGALGALSQDRALAAAWASEHPHLASSDATTRRISDLSRRLRLDRGLPVHPLDPAESRLAKVIAGEWPPARMYEAIAQAYDALGEEGRITADRYRQAAAWIWAPAPVTRED